MRKRGRTDENHAAVVDALRSMGATVHSAAAMGDGFPDLVVGYRGLTHLVEVKSGAKAPSARKLTPAQVAWHSAWRGGPVLVVTNPLEAIAGVGQYGWCLNAPVAKQEPRGATQAEKTTK